MKKIHNERNAGRKPKYIGNTKFKLIPVESEKEIDKLLTPYLTKKQ
jgi:hypothetical protein